MNVQCTVAQFFEKSGSLLRILPGHDADPSPPSSAKVNNRILSLRAFVDYERVKRTYLLKILAGRLVSCSKLCSVDPQMLGTAIQN
jgi:hypothetical protein